MLEEYEEALSTGQPVFLDADELAEIADYYQLNENFDKADAAIDFALSLSPGAVAPLTYKIHEALWDGDIDKARTYLDMITETDEADFVYDKAEIMLAEGDVDGAEAYLQSELEKTPEEEHQDFIVDVANIFLDYNLSEKSLEWMSRAHHEESADFKELMARTLFGVGKYKDSERLWTELVDVDPFSKRYWNALAYTQYMNRDFSNSVQSSEFAIAIDPDDAGSLLSKATGLFQLANYEEALKYFRRYSEREPDDEYGLLYQGICLYNLGRCREAIDVLNNAAEAALQVQEDDPSYEQPYLGEIYCELAFCYNELGDTDQALAMIDKAEQYNGDVVMTLVEKGHVMLSSGRYDEAERFFHEAVRQSDSPSQTILRIIISFYDNKMVELAYRMFKEYFRVVGTEASEGYPYMALCCYELKHYDEFLHYLREACDVDPRACRVALGHLFPDDVEPKDYYNYIKDRLQ